MGMDSDLIVSGTEFDNYKNQAEACLTYKREKDGKFPPIHIYCDYQTEYDILYLRVCLENFKKKYIYKLYYDIDALINKDYPEFKIIFDLQDAVNQIDPLCQEVDVCIFTCCCLEDNFKCSKHPDYDDYTIEKITVVRPINEIISDELEDLEKSIAQVKEQVESLIVTVKKLCKKFKELTLKK